MFVPNTNWMKGKDVSQMQQAKFPLEVNGVASNLNQWISDEDQSQEPTWHIEKLIHPCLKLEKEQKNVKKNTVYRSIKFWLSFLFPITSNTLYSSVLLMSGLFCRSQFMYFAGHIMLECLLSDFFLYISKLTILCLHSSLWIHVYLPHCQQVHGSLLKDTFHWKAALRNSESSARETRKYVNLKYWRDFSNVMIKVKSVKK